MRRKYLVPDIEITRYRLIDAILSSPTEGTVPIEGNKPELPDPSEELEGDGLGV